jgi:hypothetical protein
MTQGNFPQEAGKSFSFIVPRLSVSEVIDERSIPALLAE